MPHRKVGLWEKRVTERDSEVGVRRSGSVGGW